MRSRRLIVCRDLKANSEKLIVTRNCASFVVASCFDRRRRHVFHLKLDNRKKTYQGSVYKFINLTSCAHFSIASGSCNKIANWTLSSINLSDGKSWQVKCLRHFINPFDIANRNLHRTKRDFLCWWRVQHCGAVMWFKLDISTTTR